MSNSHVWTVGKAMRKGRTDLLETRNGAYVPIQIMRPIKFDGEYEIDKYPWRVNLQPQGKTQLGKPRDTTRIRKEYRYNARGIHDSYHGSNVWDLVLKPHVASHEQPILCSICQTHIGWRNPRLISMDQVLACCFSCEKELKINRNRQIRTATNQSDKGVVYRDMILRSINRVRVPKPYIAEVLWFLEFANWPGRVTGLRKNNEGQK